MEKRKMRKELQLQLSQPDNMRYYQKGLASAGSIESQRIGRRSITQLNSWLITTTAYQWIGLG
jgi:hypothetical protein